MPIIQIGESQPLERQIELPRIGTCQVVDQIGVQGKQRAEVLDVVLRLQAVIAVQQETQFVVIKQREFFAEGAGGHLEPGIGEL